MDQGDGTCIRMPHDGPTATFPILDPTSSDMVCGRDGLSAVPYVCPVPGSSPSNTTKLTLLFRAWPDASNPGAIDHKGPCSVYLKRVSPSGTDASGGGWFKIWDQGYDADKQLWCLEKLQAAGGLLTVELPSALPAGYYLVRPELLALHNSWEGKPQFFVGCAQVYISGVDGGQLSIPADKEATIPGHLKIADPGVSYNIYTQPLVLPYPIPGPGRFFPVLSSTSSASASSEAQIEGLIPPTCIIKNANWCGVEVDSYTTEAGCWNASETCYKQAETCYKFAPPTGDRNCKVMTTKCDGIRDACDAGQWTGPPNAGKKLVEDTPALPGPIPAAEEVQGTVATLGGVSAAESKTSMLTLTTKTWTGYPTTTTTTAPTGKVVAAAQTSTTPVRPCGRRSKRFERRHV